MNAAELHLALNHLPLFTTLFGAAILLIGLVKRSLVSKRIGLWFFVISGLSVLPVYFSGEPAEHLLKQSSHAMEVKGRIHEHELAAPFALYGSLAVGLASAVVLFLARKRALPVAYYGAVAFLGVFVLSILLRTSYLGGFIRHDEIETAAPPAPTAP